MTNSNMQCILKVKASSTLDKEIAKELEKEEEIDVKTLETLLSNDATSSK